MVYVIVVKDGEILFSLGGESRLAPPPQLGCSRGQGCKGRGKSSPPPPSLCEGRGTIGIWALDISNFGRISKNAVHVDILFISRLE